MTGAAHGDTSLSMPDRGGLSALTLPPARPAQGGQAGAAALRRAQKFIDLVRTEGTDAIGAYLDALDRTALYGLTVALAALVPDDVPVSDLLAWLEPRSHHTATPKTLTDLEAS